MRWADKEGRVAVETRQAATRDEVGRLSERERRRSILLLALTTGFFWAALYLYVPILPVYGVALGATLPTVGLLVGAYGFGQLLLRIPLGAWSDRIGQRRPFVAAGLVVASLGAAALALANDPAALILARGLTGVAAAAWVVFSVLFASYFPSQRATYAISIINFVNIAAQAVATYGGSVLAEAYGWHASFWGAVALGGLGLISLLGVRERRLTRSSPLTMRGILRVITTPLLLVVAGAATIGTAINFATSFGFVPVYATELGASRADLGTLTAARLVPFAVATLATAWIVDRLGARVTVVSGSALLAVANLFVPWAHDLNVLAVLQAVGGVGFGFSSPVLMGLSIRAVPNEERATAMGAYQALYSAGMIVGPWAGGWLAELAGLGSVFLAAAALAVGSAVLVALKAPRQ